MSSMIKYENEGTTGTAYLAEPKTGTGSGVLVLHAWWGLNDFFKSFCDRLSEAGFVALAPDLYDGTMNPLMAFGNSKVRFVQLARM